MAATKSASTVGMHCCSCCQGLASACLPLVGQHRLDASRTKPLAHVADRLLREIQCLGNFGIRPAFIAFQEHSRPGIRFPASHKRLHVVSFVTASAHRSWSSHQIFSRFPSAYHKFQIGLTTRLYPLARQNMKGRGRFSHRKDERDT